jgi:transposase InsO family protein
VSIIESMVIDMNEAQVRTLQQVREVLAGTQAIEFRRAEDDEGRYAWIEQVLRRLGYRQLGRADRGVVLRYLQRFGGYSRAQTTRLVSRAGGGRPLVKQYRAPEHAFARRYTAADVALLAEVDRAMGTMSGPATACVLRRQRDVFGDARFERLADLSVGHLYNLRASAGYRQHRVVHSKTQPTKSVSIGVRKAPAPEGRAGFIRIDSVHQGDQDGIKGLYHINAVDCITQWQVVASVQSISEAHLLPVLQQMLEQFPFDILGFHADNGSEYVNHTVAHLLEKLRIEFTRSRPRHSNDNGLAETKNGAVVRKQFGYAHIPQRHAERFNTYCVEYLNPFLNFHRPCLFATERLDPKKPGRIKRIYRPQDAMTPLDKLASLAEEQRSLRSGITLQHLRELATALSDLQAAEELNEARAQLFKRAFSRAEPDRTSARSA